MRSASRLGAAGLALALMPSAAQADGEERAWIDVSLGIGYSTNPLSGGTGDGGVFGQIGIRPRVEIVSERSTLILTSDAQIKRVLNQDEDFSSYRAALNYTTRLSERLRVNGSISYASSILGALERLDALVDEDDIPLPDGDLGLVDRRIRRQSASAQVGASVGLSAVSSLDVSGYGRLARYSGRGLLVDYDTFGGTLGYNRTLSDRLKVGVRSSVSLVDYSDASRGSSRTYSLEATGALQLSEYWSLSGAAGVSYTQGFVGGGGDHALTGNVSLCRDDSRTKFCATAGRSFQPSGLAGTRVQTNLGASYSRRVSERGRASIGANYVAVDGRGLNASGDSYLRTVAGYEQGIDRRLSVSASAFYRKIFNSAVERDSDLGGQVGVTYRFGDVQ